VVARTAGDGALTIFDHNYQKLLALKEDLSRGFAITDGIEFPAAGFGVVA
jgi:hypothetical protein